MRNGVLLLGAGCTAPATIGDKPAVGEGDRTGAGTVVTVIHYNDLHAHLVSHSDLVPDADWGESAATTMMVELGGVARIQTILPPRWTVWRWSEQSRPTASHLGRRSTPS